MRKVISNNIGNQAYFSVELRIEYDEFACIRYWIRNQAIGDINQLTHKWTIYSGLKDLLDSFSNLQVVNTCPQSADEFFERVITRDEELQSWIIYPTPEYTVKITFECECFDGNLVYVVKMADKTIFFIMNLVERTQQKVILNHVQFLGVIKQAALLVKKEIDGSHRGQNKRDL